MPSYIDVSLLDMALQIALLLTDVTSVVAINSWIELFVLFRVSYMV